MNKSSILILILILIFIQSLHAQLWTVTEMATLPEPVTNNAVAEGFVNDTAFVYSFGGLDPNKTHLGIHGRSYRYNTSSDTWSPLPALPDTLGKIAMGANRIGNIIYIMGGYHVYANGNEKSSDRVHRFYTQTNSFLADGTAIPIPIDDQVQAVWRDSLIFLITGWSETTNLPVVQIYNPAADSWAVGTPVPNNNTFKSFGASGVIIKDTIYYFGGAAIGPSFPIQNALRKGIINPNNPTQIIWSTEVLSNSLVGYRMASTVVDEFAHWLGGSFTTYNYDGIAYNGTGGVSPSHQNIFLNTQTQGWNVETSNILPMDLRGIAATERYTRYLVGGMESGQMVSNKTLRLDYTRLTPNAIEEGNFIFYELKVSPNPFKDVLSLEWKTHQQVSVNLILYDVAGKQLIERSTTHDRLNWSLGHLPAGIYFLEFQTAQGSFRRKIIKQ